MIGLYRLEKILNSFHDMVPETIPNFLILLTRSPGAGLEKF